MNLMKCPDCGREVSKKATSCPGCGHPFATPQAAVQQKKKGSGCLGVIGVLLFAMLAASVMDKCSPNNAADSTTPNPAVETQKSNEEMLRISACNKAQTVIKEKLKSPSTAKFPSCIFSANDYQITASPDLQKVGVQGFVDSQNGFGAMLRSRFVVIFKRTGTGFLPSDLTVDEAGVQ